MKAILKPFDILPSKQRNLVTIGWATVLALYWLISASVGTTHLFPTPSQVLTGFEKLFAEGLVVHLLNSLTLCAMAVIGSVSLSLLVSYVSPVPLLKPMSSFVSRLRYLPLVGLSFYINILIQGDRAIQVAMLIVFMSTFLTTSLLSMIKDIPEQELDHARTLGCTRWEVLLEVVVKGRVDYVVEIVRQNLAIVWMSLVTAESLLPSQGGLGFLIQNSSKMGNHGRIIALYIVILLVGLLLDNALTYLRKAIFRYSKI